MEKEIPKKLIRIILVIGFLVLTIIGGLIGYSFYYEQLHSNPAYLLIFIPDCPFYIMLALLVYFKIIDFDWFAFLLSVGLIKYGIWTEMVFLLHPSYYFVPAMIGGTIFLAIIHFGMIFESLLFIPKKVSKLGLGITIGWFLLNDYMDYVIGIMPRIPTYNLHLVIPLTVAMSLVIPLFLKYVVIDKYYNKKAIKQKGLVARIINKARKYILFKSSN